MAPPVDSDLDASDPFEGTKYRSISVLGKGGMGAAHVVEHRLLGTFLVCKVLRGRYRNNAALADRMRVEAQSLARLVHPNIVKVFDFDFTQDGRPFIVMERLEGHTLGHELRLRGELPIREAVDLTRQLLSALAAAHTLGIVHRDIKLENLFLQRETAEKTTLKVLDFGVAKILDGFSDAAPTPPQFPTRAGIVVGTPGFMSPEAASGKAVDQRADIYSAGVVLYMLVCGRSPWEDAAQVADVPPSPCAFASQAISADLESIVMTAISGEKEDRFQTAQAFDAALNTVALRLQDKSTVPMTPDSEPRRPAPAPAGTGTLRLSEDLETRTAFPAFADPRPAAGAGTAVKMLAFALSAVVAALLTWWCLVRFFPR